MSKYANPVVLILDEWLLLKIINSERKVIFKLIHQRCKKATTPFFSQYEFDEWYNNPLADAIIDRIAITAIASTSQALMPNITSPCVRSMVWTKHYKNKLA